MLTWRHCTDLSWPSWLITPCNQPGPALPINLQVIWAPDYRANTITMRINSRWDNVRIQRILATLRSWGFASHLKCIDVILTALSSLAVKPSMPPVMTRQFTIFTNLAKHRRVSSSEVKSEEEEEGEGGGGGGGGYRRRGGGGGDEDEDEDYFIKKLIHVSGLQKIAN